jgi:hypothetical protein
MGAAAFRALFGVALVAAPGPVGGGWIGSEASRPPAQTMIRGLGGRDIGIGLGGVLALLGDDRPDIWLGAGAVSDLADFFATLAARDHIPPGKWVPSLAFIALSTAANGALAAALAD